MDTQEILKIREVRNDWEVNQHLAVGWKYLGMNSVTEDGVTRPIYVVCWMTYKAAVDPDYWKKQNEAREAEEKRMFGDSDTGESPE